MTRPYFAFSYAGVRVRDLDRSITFYTEVLGLRLEKRAEEGANKGEYALVEDKRTGQSLELNWYAEDSPVAQPYPDAEGEELDHLGFEVTDLEAALRYLADHGFPSVAEPVRDGGFAVAFVKDPDGIWIELFQRLSPGR